MLMVSDKTTHKFFRIQKTKPIRYFFFINHYLPKLYFGFNYVES